MTEKSNVVDFKTTATDLAERAAAGDTDAGRALQEIVVNYGQWRASKSEAVKVGKETKEAVQMQEASVGKEIEETLPASPSKAAILGKLESVEGAWQTLQEAKAERTEEQKRVKGNLKKWGKKLEESISNSAQMTLPKVG